MGKWFYSVKYMKDESYTQDKYKRKKRDCTIQETLTELQREVQTSLFYYEQQEHCDFEKLEKYRGECRNVLSTHEGFEEKKQALASLTKKIKRACQPPNTTMAVHICLGNYVVRFNRSNRVVSEYINTLGIPCEMKKNDIIVKPKIYEEFLGYLEVLTNKLHSVKTK